MAELSSEDSIEENGETRRERAGFSQDGCVAVGASEVSSFQERLQESRKLHLVDVAAEASVALDARLRSS